MGKKLLLFGFFVLAGSGVFAQTIGLEEARALALVNSRSLARYNLAIRSSLLDERGHLYTMLPSISVGYSASVYYLGRDWRFVNPVDTFNSGLDIAITQIIFNGGRNFIQKAIRQISTESIRKEALAEYFNVLDAVDNAYYAVLEALATLEAAESSLQTALTSLEMAEIRHASGMISLGDYLRAMAEREARENTRNQARRSLALSRTRFRALTGIADTVKLEEVNFDAYEELIQALSRISDEEADIMFDRFWQVLSAANPSLARAALNTQRAEKNLTLARREHAPVLSATVFAAGINFSPATGFGSSSGGGFLIRGSIPVDFWVLNNRVERSRLARDSSVLDYLNTEINLGTELQSALLNVFAFAESVHHSRLTLSYTERHFEFVSERHRLLQSSVADLNEASTMLINSRNNLIRARYGFLQSISRLRSLGAIDNREFLIELLMGR